MCDAINDTVLDALLAIDPACEARMDEALDEID